MPEGRCHARLPCDRAARPKRFHQGFRMVTATADQVALGAGAAASLAAARADVTGDGEKGGSLY